MADRIADNPELLVDELKRKARRRLVGAIVLALAAAVILPLLLEQEPRPLGDDVSVQIPPVDEGKFVNRLTGKSGEPKALPRPDAKSAPRTDEKADPKGAVARSEPKPDAVVAAAKSQAMVSGATPAPPSSEESTAPKKPVADVEPRGQAAAAKDEAKSAPAAMAETKPAPTAKAETKPAPAVKTETKPAPAPKAEAKAPAAAEGKIESSPTVPDPKTAAIGATQAPPVTTSDAPAGAPAAVPVKADGFVVQLAAFADDKGANALANKLKRVGYAAYVEPVQTSRGTLWRVRVGGYASRSDADAARVKLKGEGYSGIVAPS
jgi:DedD protein